MAHTSRKPEWFAVIVRRTGLIELPSTVEFELGQRVYFQLAGGEIRVTQWPAIWRDGRYRSARIRRTAGSLAQASWLLDGSSVRQRIADKVRQMIVESGAATERFDVDDWVDHWLNMPLAQLEGRSPAEVIDTREGFCAVEAILESMRGGTPG